MRAPRFPLHLSVRYRRVGDRQWRRGQTENISRSGVLIRGEDPLEIDATVELMVALAVRSAAATTGEVQCSGRVVRTISPASGHTLPGSAVLIENYNFLPSDAGIVGSASR
jgi:hypothetical protein